MKKQKFFSCLLAALIAAFSIPSVFAATYQISDGLKFQLETGEVYLAGIEDDRTALDVPSAMNGYPVTATTMDFAQNNANLESVTFANAENISIIGSYGFYNCTNLRTVNLGSYVTELYRGVFRGCTSLESVELSDNLTEIPYESFYGCTSLGEITIGRNITLIQENAFIGCPNLVIRCYYDSYAYQFALDHSIPYILLDGVLLGDTNADENIDVADVTQIQKFLAELAELDGIYLHAADANQDGTVDISDATALQMYIAEYDLPYPIGEVMTQ